MSPPLKRPYSSQHTGQAIDDNTRTHTGGRGRYLPGGVDLRLPKPTQLPRKPCHHRLPRRNAHCPRAAGFGGIGCNAAGKNGFDVCKEVRQFFAKPILMMTASGDEVDEILGLELGPMTTSPNR